MHNNASDTILVIMMKLKCIHLWINWTWTWTCTVYDNYRNFCRSQTNL